MSLLLELFYFAVPMVILSWVLPKKYALLSQILLTASFIILKSTLSFFILSFISFGNFYLLHKSNFSKSIKISISLLFLGILIYAAKILVSINHDWIIPLGLSYYIFKNIHYSLEYYKDKLKDPSLLFYLSFNFFLPVILIGPINRYQDFVRDWQRRRFNSEYFSSGIELILFGVSKILILGNYLFTYKFLKLITEMDDKYLWLKTYLETIRFVFNAYFQFAGYSDIAVGFSFLLGFRIIENFNYPFLATNMGDFWARYHISLSSFCKDYIYTPIVSYYRKPLFGIISTMLIIGLWHEISVRYLIWGVMQAAGIFLASVFKNRSNSVITTNLGRLFVINFFALSCVIISQDQLVKALALYKILFFIN